MERVRSNNVKSHAMRKDHTGKAINLRSRITNGTRLLPGVDHRSTWARRYFDLIELHLSDRGGDEHVTEGERALIKRVATLTVELERLEVRFAQNEGAGRMELETYQRASNSLRRLIQSLGVKRHEPKDVTPDHESSFSRFIGHLDDTEVDDVEVDE